MVTHGAKVKFSAGREGAPATRPVALLSCFPKHELPRFGDAFFCRRFQTEIRQFDNRFVAQFDADCVEESIFSVDLPVAAPIVVIDRQGPLDRHAGDEKGSRDHCHPYYRSGAQRPD